MKEVEGYIEKDRTFRDRTKKKRLTVDEKRELANDLKPKHAPYHRRKKDWMQLPSEDEYPDAGWSCGPDCGHCKRDDHELLCNPVIPFSECPNCNPNGDF